jgi:hypothetical protein
VAKEETRVMGVLWGHSYRCKECGIVHGSSLINSADKEKLPTLRSEYVHVGNEGGGGGAAGRGNAGRQLMEQVMSVASSVAAVTEGPVRDALGAVKTWSMPTYWVPDSEIFECAACGSDFSEGRPRPLTPNACLTKTAPKTLNSRNSRIFSWTAQRARKHPNPHTLKP